MNYFVALGAPAPLDALERTLQAACPGAQVRPVSRSDLRGAFPDTENVVLVGMSRTSTHDAVSGFVSRRHTTTAMLRQLVRRTAQEFGEVRVLVYRGESDLPPSSIGSVRSQTTTLAGFLRSGRVVQDGTLLSIKPS